VHRIKGRAGLRLFKIQNVRDRTEEKEKTLKGSLENCIQLLDKI